MSFNLFWHDWFAENQFHLFPSLVVQLATQHQCLQHPMYVARGVKGVAVAAVDVQRYHRHFGLAYEFDDRWLPLAVADQEFSFSENQS